METEVGLFRSYFVLIEIEINRAFFTFISIQLKQKGTGTKSPIQPSGTVEFALRFQSVENNMMKRMCALFISLSNYADKSEV